MNIQISHHDYEKASQLIKSWGNDLGFQQLGITDIQLDEDEQYLKEWLAKGFHGDMQNMSAHGIKRSRPEKINPGNDTGDFSSYGLFPPFQRTPLNSFR